MNSPSAVRNMGLLFFFGLLTTIISAVNLYFSNNAGEGIPRYAYLLAIITSGIVWSLVLIFRNRGLAQTPVQSAAFDRKFKWVLFLMFPALLAIIFISRYVEGQDGIPIFLSAAIYGILAIFVFGILGKVFGANDFYILSVLGSLWVFFNEICYDGVSLGVGIVILLIGAVAVSRKRGSTLDPSSAD